MAQPIEYTDPVITQIMEAFKKQLQKKRNGYAASPKITINTSLETNTEVPIILNWAALAWLKMRTLINCCDKEIAWHGIIEANEEHTYFTVKDIIMYPQKVTGATVNADDEGEVNKYETWHQALCDDYYNNMRLQGHSHVNMPTNPSGTDINTYDELLSLIREDSYYIFMISNKRGDYWYRIFDKAHNIVYNESDITVTIDGVNLNDWYNANIKQFLTLNTFHNKYNSTYYNKPTEFGKQTNAAPKTKEVVEPGFFIDMQGNKRRVGTFKTFADDTDPIGIDDMPPDDYDPATDPFYAANDLRTFQEDVEKSKKSGRKTKKGSKK